MIQNFSPLAVGDFLADRYTVVSLLGTGGMGAVYAAHDRVNDMEVAVKVLRPEVRGVMSDRFEREILIATRLNHDNIVRTLDHGWDRQSGIRFVTMELLKGRTLEDLIDEPKRPLSMVQGVQIAYQICDALIYAHSPGQELVHRDLKPANIFLCEDPRGRTRVKVMDFGIARPISADSGSRGRRRKLTTLGQSLGTPQYMPPEQWMGEPVFKSDVYALGILMYLMAEGRFPSAQQKGSMEYWAYYHNAENPAPMIRCDSPRYRHLVFRMLAKNPAERPTPVEVQDELEGIFGEVAETGALASARHLLSGLGGMTPQPGAPAVPMSGPEAMTVRNPLLERAGADEDTVHQLGDSALIVREDTGGVPMPIPVEKTRLSPRASAPTRISRGPNAPTRITSQPVPTPPRRRRWWPWGRRT